MRCLGATTRNKKIVFVSVQVSACLVASCTHTTAADWAGGDWQSLMSPCDLQFTGLEWYLLLNAALR